MLTYILVTALIGLFVGALGRLSLPGPDPMSIWMTMGIGIVATFLASFAVYALMGDRYGVTIPVAAAFATGIVYLVRRRRGGGLEDPGIDPRTGRRLRRRGGAAPRAPRPRGPPAPSPPHPPRPPAGPTPGRPARPPGLR